MSRVILLGFCVAALAAGQAPKKTVKRAPAAAKKSALNKATFEAYIRHLLPWIPPVEVKISDPVPSKELPGFFEVTATGTLGKFSQNEKFLVSKDGQKILRAAVYDVKQNPFKPEIDKLNTQFQPSLGTPGATVVLVVFTDFQCPFCKEEAKMLRQNLLSAYPKQVRLYFKDFPLEQIHPWAKPASIAGRCVFRQNAAMFWNYHDWIYENQVAITKENLKSKVLDWAKDKDIDTLQLTGCLDSRATEKDVDANIADAKALGVASTPTLFVNGRRLVGQVGWPQLRQIIDYEIEYQKTARNAGEDCGCEVALPVPGAAPAPASSTTPTALIPSRDRKGAVP